MGKRPLDVPDLRWGRVSITVFLSCVLTYPVLRYAESIDPNLDLVVLIVFTALFHVLYRRFDRNGTWLLKPEYRNPKAEGEDNRR